jgi:hypothetical protein
MAINKDVGGKKKRKKLSDLAASSDDDCDSGSGKNSRFHVRLY